MPLALLLQERLGVMTVGLRREQIERENARMEEAAGR